MDQVTFGIILFICTISSLLCVGQGAIYGANCSSEACTSNMYMACNASSICVCDTGHVENNNADGCLTELGYDCNDNVSCQDVAATCDTICKCNTTAHYDSNGLGTNSGLCVPKFSLGQTCPAPTTEVPDTATCSESEARCEGDSTNGYNCRCLGTHFDDDGVGNEGGGCVLKFSLGQTCPAPTTDVPDTATCSESEARCEGDSTNGYNCRCLSTHFDDDGVGNEGGGCVLKFSLGQTCPAPTTEVPDTATCSESEARCEGDSTNGYNCRCLGTHFDDDGVGNEGGGCVLKFSLGQTCPAPTTEVPDTATCSESEARCEGDSTNGYNCRCLGTHFDDDGVGNEGGGCVLKFSLGQTCPAPTTEVPDTATCRESEARCEGDSTNGYNCRCLGTHFDDDGVGSEGGGCVLKFSLGQTCPAPTTEVPDTATCSESEARCEGDSTNGYNCRCLGTHFDDDGVGNEGGGCVLKFSLGQTCPAPTTEVPDTATCSESEARCEGDSTNGYNCRCLGTHFDDDGVGNEGGGCVLKFSLGQTCPAPTTEVPDTATCSESEARCEGDSTNGYNCRCLGTHFDDDGVGNEGGGCVLKFSLGQTCPAPTTEVPDTATCRESEARCEGDSTNGYNCRCLGTHFDDDGVGNEGGGCVLKFSLGQTCPVPTTEVPDTATCSESEARCEGDSTNGYNCRCLGTHFDDDGVGNEGGGCVLKFSLGQTCPAPTTEVPDTATCSESEARCEGDSTNGYNCRCLSTHFDDDGVGKEGGRCVLKFSLGQTCPAPTTEVPDTATCSESEARCEGDSTNGYNCRCLGTHFDDDGVGNEGGGCVLKFSLGQTCPAPTTEVPDTATCIESEARCEGDSTNGYNCRCLGIHFDDDGVGNEGGGCVLKFSLGQTCPVPTTEVPDTATCSESEARCEGDSTNGYNCRCLGTHFDDDGVGNEGGGCVLKFSLGQTCPAPTTEVPDTATCSESEARCEGDSTNGYNCRCLGTHFDDDGVGKEGGRCVLKSSIEASCPDPVSLNPSNIHTCSDINAGCIASDGNYKCQCFDTHYDNKQNGNRKCVSKVDLGYVCPMPDACLTANALCSGSTCKCDELFFDSNTADTLGGSCMNRIDLSGVCTISGSSTNYLQCKDLNAKCSSNNNQYLCTCNQGYHNESNVCVANKALGESCEGVSGECSDPNAACLDIKCTCSVGFYDDNGFDASGNCRAISDLQVTGITFSGVQTTQFVVSWTPPTGKESYVNGYTVGWYPTDNSVGGSSEELVSGSTSYTITTGITPGKAYHVSITSKNDQTQQGSLRSTSSYKEQASEPGIPGAIDKETSDLDIDGGITLHWTAPTGVVSGYTVTLSDGADDTSSSRTSASVTFTPSYLKNGHRYTVTIQAKSQTFVGGSPILGQVYTEEIKTVVTVPSEPQTFTCDTIKDESIVFKWLPPTNPNGDLVSYILEVYDFSGQLQFTNETSGVVLTYEVDHLSPGTTYIFRVYTKNEEYPSSTYGSTTCMTKARLSEPPTDLHTTNITSRNFDVSWDRPNEIYSEEIYGYVLQMKRDDVCVKEVVYKCSDCTGSLVISDLENMCNSTVREVVDKSKIELGIVQTYTVLAGSLLPDTIYAISVTAVNNIGRGNVADITQLTMEEAPNKPESVTVNEINTTSLKVTWSIEGDRPGQTNYTVILSADRPAQSMEFTVIGFEMRTFVATALEEFWNYTVEVKAATSIGEVTSDVTNKYRTLPTAPGDVTQFTITKHPSGDYTKLKISWEAPFILERNSIITDYNLIHNATSNNVMQTYNSPANSAQHETMLNVTPEHYYSFQVFAVNDEGKEGSKVEEIVEAPAGVPKNDFEAKDTNNKVIPEGTVKNVGQTTFTLSIFSDFFKQNVYGLVRATGLLGCAKDKCESFTSGITLVDFNTMATWKTAEANQFTTYRITDHSWLIDASDTQTGRRRRDVPDTDIEYAVGADNCVNQAEDVFCNGPLASNTQYFIIAVVCTNGGCLLSNQYGPFITAAIPDDNGGLVMILGVVAGVVVVMAVAAGVAFFIIKRRRNEASTMGKVSKQDEENGFGNLDPAVAKIPKKRPILLHEIEEYVTNMHKDSNLLFSAEYDDLKTLSPKHLCDAADREENRMRNRYINIIAFDHTRVKLSTNGEDDTADYINANYLPGYTSPREYIGCQGPLPGTIDDFWRMVWEQNVSVIVILTLCKEGQKVKCEQYWPDEVGEPKQYGDVIVETTSFSSIRTYDYRMFKITNGDTTRVIKHFHFLSWLDFQANVHHDIILDFIEHVRGHVQPPDTSGPMIIHCSAGVGRTGTYIALDHLMQFINEHDFDVQIDIFDMVLKLRDNRQHMVQTEQQYVFIHDSVKEIMERKRRALEENLYENQGFAQDENLYENVSKSEQNTEL